MSIWAKVLQKKNGQSYNDGGEIPPEDITPPPPQTEQEPGIDPKILREKLVQMGVAPESLDNIEKKVAEEPETTPPEVKNAMAKGVNLGGLLGTPTSRELAQADPEASAEAMARGSEPEAPGEPNLHGTSSKDNVQSLRDQLEKYIGKQSGGLDHMEQLGKMLKEQSAKENDRPNYSPLNALADYYYGTNLSKTFAPPKKQSELLEDELKNEQDLNKARQPLTGDLLKEYGTDNNAVSKEQANYYRGINSEQKEKARTDHFLDQQEEKMAKAMNPLSSAYGSGNNNLGARIGRARSALATLRQHPSLDLDPREQKDFALATAALISNQNRVPYELVRDLVPKTFSGDYSKAVEYFANHPEDTNSQEFVKRMMNTVQKERETATAQIKQIQQQQAQGFHQLAVKRPSSHQTLLAGANNFVDMPELDTVDYNVKVLDPKTGKVHAIPQSQVDAAVKAGGKVVK